MKGDDGAALGAVAGFHGEGHAVLADPADGFGAFCAGEGIDGDFIRDHKGGIEAQTKVADNAALVIALVILQEFFGTGESDLVDVLFDFLGRHADAVIGKTNLFCFFIQRDGDTIVAFLVGVKHFFFGDGITAVGNHFADEDVLIGIEPALNDGHDVLRVDGNVAFLLLGHSRRLR